MLFFPCAIEKKKFWLKSWNARGDSGLAGFEKALQQPMCADKDRIFTVTQATSGSSPRTQEMVGNVSI